MPYMKPGGMRIPYTRATRFAPPTNRGSLSPEVNVNWAQFQLWVTHPIVQSLLIIAIGYLASLAVDLVGLRALARVVSSTETDFDDQIIAECRQPLRTSVVLASMWFALAFNDPLPQVGFFLEGVISSWALMIWARALF